MNRAGNRTTPSITIRGRQIGRGFPTYFIAEIGSNHQGSLERAKELITLSAKAGADAVKFQSWTAPLLQNRKDVGPDGRLSDSKVLPVLERYELPEAWHGELLAHSEAAGVDFLSTPFDIGKARLLRSLAVPAIKVSSSDLTYEELLEEISTFSLPVILSTGMGSLGEIERALSILARQDVPVALLHCVAAYPPQPGDANLAAIDTLEAAFDLPVGFSDHFPGHDVDVAAVVRGAAIIEKHVTISRSDGAPDSFYALEIDEFRAMVEAVRSVEIAMGDGRKRCMPSERAGLVNGRRCLYSARDIAAGSILTRADIAVVRPNIGELQPSDLGRAIGKRARTHIDAGVPLSWDHLETL